MSEHACEHCSYDFDGKRLYCAAPCPDCDDGIAGSDDGDEHTCHTCNGTALSPDPTSAKKEDAKR